jgi:hypothetical protein
MWNYIGLYIIVGYVVTMLCAARSAIESSNPTCDFKLELVLYMMIMWPTIVVAYFVELAVIILISILDLVPLVSPTLSKVLLFLPTKLYNRIYSWKSSEDVNYP